MRFLVVLFSGLLGAEWGGDAEHNAFAWAYELLGQEPDSID
jgi:hypothetical protein